MGLMAAKTGLTFPMGTFDASAAGVEKYKTPNGVGPKIGTLSYLAMKEAEFRVVVGSDSSGVVRLKADSELLGEFQFVGDSAGSVVVDLASVQGQTRLEMSVEVTTAGSGTGNVQGFVDIDQPPVINGC